MAFLLLCFGTFNVMLSLFVYWEYPYVGNYPQGNNNITINGSYTCKPVYCIVYINGSINDYINDKQEANRNQTGSSGW
jgi:hypothetical protein